MKVDPNTFGTMAGRGRGSMIEQTLGGGQRMSTEGLTFGNQDIKTDAWLSAQTSGTSIFDPVLAELAYRWFCAPSGVVLDPFAGGSVRGIVAAALGRHYVGVDLRPEQIEANEQQWRDVSPRLMAGCPAPRWICGDSQDIGALAADVAADFVFSCPPYAHLEVYSDDPKDLSTMGYKDFVAAYRRIIAAAVGRLKKDRFACFVVGEVRDAKGYYVNFVSDTIAAFEAAGARHYNEAILVTACGSLPIRAGRTFEGGRKLGKTHQNVLVFCKGDWKKATEAVGPVEFGDIPSDGEEAADPNDPAAAFGEVLR